MSATDLTLFAGTAGMLVSSIAIPAWRRFRSRLASTDANREVTWEAINLAIARERDNAVAALAAQQKAHAAELAAMREQMVRDAAELKQLHDAETQQLRARVEYCQSEISRLHQELYNVTRQNRPPAPPAPG